MNKIARHLKIAVMPAALCAFLLCAGFALPAFGASADDYRTPEYMAGRGLDAIHAAEAYALGYSGKGVTVGVLDTVAFPLHHEFFEKTPYPVEYFTTPDETIWHGVHTAGTIAASRNNAGMHGVAYGANLVSIVGIDDTDNVTTMEAIRAFRKYPDVSIVSNSWGPANFSLASWPWADKDQAVIDHLKAVAGAMASLAAESGTLFIFAAGNDGHSSPGMPAPLPSWLTGATLIGERKIDPATGLALTDDERRALSLGMISVSAFDPGSAFNRLDFIASFSDLADGAAHYSLLAPGVDIYSSIGPGANDYTLMPGTSMAAPHVAGVAALVQEAFPWMNGKQIADTLLSTATHPKDMQGLPPFLIQTYSEPNGQRLFSVTVPDTFSGIFSSALLDEHKEEIRRLWESSVFSRVDSLESFTARLAAAMDGKSNTDPNEQWDNSNPKEPTPVHKITEKQYMALFGMGVVNAGAAVRGPGWLDANRLSDGDLAGYGGKDYAMYGVDTKGYSGVWSHDIGQVKVEDSVNKAEYPNGVLVPAPNQFNSRLEDLDVGLRKKGAGRLYLTGNNSYKGPTVVAGGEISLGITGQSDKTARLFQDVYVEPAGVFSGNGYVGGNLYSRGTVSPGLESGPSDLTVKGNVTSSGKLLVHLWPEAGRANRLLVGAGSTLEFGGTEVDVLDMAGSDYLPFGNYAIVESSSLSGRPINVTDESRQGVTLLHTFSLRTEDNTLYLRYNGTSVNPQSKALTEGYIGGTAMLNQGADLAAGAGLENAASAARSAAKRAAPGQAYGVSAFGAISAGWSRYNTGSHVDVSGFSLLTGFSIGRELPPGFLSLGAFFEFGGGFYDTYNSFNNAASVRGDGETEYFGGGILGRMDFARTGPGYFHAEASARTGMVLTDYEGTDLRDYTGRAASYSSESAYYGLHAGLGYAWEITDAAVLDLYGKYFWTRQAGDTVRLSSGESVRFKDTDSSRVRAGGRFSYTIDGTITPYIGAAWEHEFDGMARATTNGFSLPSPSLHGATGVGELGLTIKAGDFISLDLGIQGYSGKREGATGSAQVKIEF